jgi:hypothetical protein
MDLDNAIGKHAEWKLKLRAAIAKKESLDAAAIASDDVCELGQWLHGEANVKFGRLPSHAECVSKHAAFHVEAGKVAAAINAARYDRASEMLALGSGYTTTSTAVGMAIMHLKKAAGL